MVWLTNYVKWYWVIIKMIKFTSSHYQAHKQLLWDSIYIYSKASYLKSVSYYDMWHYTEKLISKACHCRYTKLFATIFVVFWKKNRFEIFLKLHTFYCSCCAINFTKWSVIIIFFDIKILLWCYVKWHKRKPSFAHNLKFIALSVYCATTTWLASYTQFYYTLVHIF